MKYTTVLIFFLAFNASAQLPREDHHMNQMALAAWLPPVLNHDLNSPDTARFYSVHKDSAQNLLNLALKLSQGYMSSTTSDERIVNRILPVTQDIDTSLQQIPSDRIPDSVTFLFMHHYGRDIPCCTPSRSYNHWFAPDSSYRVALNLFDSIFSGRYPRATYIESGKYLVLQFFNRYIGNNSFEYEFALYFLKPDED